MLPSLFGYLNYHPTTHDHAALKCTGYIPAELPTPVDASDRGQACYLVGEVLQSCENDINVFTALYDIDDLEYTCNVQRAACSVQRVNCSFVSLAGSRSTTSVTPLRVS